MAWMYLVPLVVFWLDKGPLLLCRRSLSHALAMGAVACERWLTRIPRWAANGRSRLLCGSAFCGRLFLCRLGAARRPIGPLRDFALSTARICAKSSAGMIWSRPSPGFAIPFPRISRPSRHHRRQLRRAGRDRDARPGYHLPPPISMTNSAWLRGYPTPPPQRSSWLALRRNG